jgi:hypothetical protein
MTLPTDLDPREMDLIDKVARRTQPGAFMYESNDVAPAIRAINENKRAEARAYAYSIIGLVRGHDAARRAEKEGT